MKKFVIKISLIALFIACSSIKAFSQEINIVFAIDNNYVQFTLIAIDSILKNNVSKSKYNFYILENNLSSRNKYKLKSFVQKNNQNISFIYSDTYVIDSGNNFQTGIVKSAEMYLTKICTARILIPELLPKNIHKALYLDSDILVLSDIKELYNTNLDEYPIGMVMTQLYYEKFYEDSLSDGSINMDKNKVYNNSGVILFDLDKCRNEMVTKTWIDVAHLDKEYKYADQDIIYNSSVKIKSIDPKWNNQYRPYRDSFIAPIENGGIIHYITRCKPWLFCPHNSFAKRMYLINWLHTDFRTYQLIYFFKAIPKIYINFLRFCYDNLQIES